MTDLPGRSSRLRQDYRWGKARSGHESQSMAGLEHPLGAISHGRTARSPLQHL